VTLRRAQTATFGIMAGMFIAASGSSNAAVAHAYRNDLLSAATTCASRPAATVSASARNGQQETATLDAVVILQRPGASPSPSATSSPTPSATVQASVSATPSASPTPSLTNSPTPDASTSASPSPSPTPTPTPTPTTTTSPTPTPTPSPTPTPKPPQLCVQVKPFSSSSVSPGRTASYAIWVWSTGAESLGTTVTVTMGNAANVEAPHFSVCPQPNGDVCTVGDLPTNQADELVAGARVRDAASAGEKITLTATARASKATSFHADATIAVAASSSTSPPAPTVPGSTLPGTSVPPLPGGAFTSPTDPSGLFPTVSPTTSTGAPAGQAQKDPGHPDATTASATLPLDSRLIGGQLAGLVVLASAIAIAIARLSLRAPRPRDGGGNST